MEVARQKQKKTSQFPNVPTNELDASYIESLEKATLPKDKVGALEEEEEDGHEEESGDMVEETPSGSIPPTLMSEDEVRAVFETHWLSKPCIICERPLAFQKGDSGEKGFHRMDQMPGMFPCCLNYAHQNCIFHSPWAMMSSNEMVCPHCTMPTGIPSTTGMVLHW